MESVNISREALLDKLRKNREAHNAIAVEAAAGYRKMAIRELAAMKRQAMAGKQFPSCLTLVEPADHTKEYDRAIKMLEMSIDENIRLPEADFQCFVMDEWRWKVNFETSNMTYSKSLRDSKRF